MIVDKKTMVHYNFDKVRFEYIVLEEVLDKLIDYRGKTPRKTDKGIPLVTAKIIKDGRILPYTEYIAEDDYDKWMTRGLPLAGDIVITTEAPLGEIAQLDNTKIALAQRIILLRGKKGVLHNGYLKYIMQTEHVKHQLNRRSSGSTVIGIKQSELRKITIPMTDYETQKEIAHILGTLDDKIELNRKMNKTLEEIAQTLYKHWFIDFEFPNEEGKPYKSSGGEMVDSELGQIPRGWRVGKLSEMFDFLEGPGIRNWQYTEEGVKFINIRLIQNGDINTSNANCVSDEEAYGKYKHFLLQERDMILSTSGTLGRSAVIRKEHLPLMLNTSVIRFRPIDNSSYAYMYRILNSDYMYNEMLAAASGSVQLNFGPMHLNKLNLIIPSNNILKQFTRLADYIDRFKALIISKTSILHVGKQHIMDVFVSTISCLPAETAKRYLGK